ncbi:MAG: hypothetical protein D6816_03445, partial [Bacteroidetes bacterium]
MEPSGVKMEGIKRNVQQERYKNMKSKLLISMLVVAGAAGNAQAGLTDGAGNPVTGGFGGPVMTGHDVSQGASSGQDTCGATTAYRAGKLAGSTEGAVAGKLFDLTIAGAPRFVARALGCTVASGQSTISV